MFRDRACRVRKAHAHHKLRSPWLTSIASSVPPAQWEVNDYLGHLIDRWGVWMEDLPGTVAEQQEAHTAAAFQRFLKADDEDDDEDDDEEDEYEDSEEDSDED